MEQLRKFKNCFTIDRKTLPIKLHFLLYALALSSLMSYFPIMAKSIGISATAFGIIYTISPFLTVLTNPVFGWITDKLQKVSLVIIAMIVIQMPLFVGTVFVPSLEKKTTYLPAELVCSSNNSFTLAYPNVSSFIIPNNTNVTCRSSCFDCNFGPNGKVCDDSVLLETERRFNFSGILKITNISAQGYEIFPACGRSPECPTFCSFNIQSEEYGKSEFLSYQFWTLLVLMVSSIVTTNAIIAIGDAACYETLEGKVNQFGKHRMGISIGWGLGTMITGYLLDLTKRSEDEQVNFTYCAYAMLILIAFDIVALTQARLSKPKPSKHIFKDVFKIFARPHPMFFAIASLLVGLLSGLQWNYFFWYLEELGASKFLLGLSMAVLCVLIEAPFMFISGYIIKRTGRDNTMVLAFSAFALWFLTMSLIKNPWWIILINLTQGPSYGLFYAAMTSYGKIATAPGTEATMQTFLGAIFHGLGIGSGSFLGGVGFDSFGGQKTFRFAGFFAICLAVIYKLLTHFVAGEGTALQRGKAEVA